MPILNWTSAHVFDTLLILVAAVYVVWLIRTELETRRFLFWLSNPRNEWRQMLHAAARVEPPSPEDHDA